MIAAEERKPEFVRALLATGAEPDHADGNGLNAFMRASSDDVRAILAAKTQRHRLDLASALAAAKTLDDRWGDDQARTYQDPISIEPRCTNCGYYQHVDFTCIQHADPRSHTPTRLSIARDSGYEMYCEKWEDEQLIALLQKGCAPTNIAYNRRHPQLIRSEERLERWRDYWRRFRIRLDATALDRHRPQVAGGSVR